MFRGIIEEEEYDSSAPNVKGYFSRISDIAEAASDNYVNQLKSNYLWQLPIFDESDESGDYDPDIIYKAVFKSIMKLVGIESETVTHYVIKEKDSEN